MEDPLGDLDQVGWSRLRHAYGPAGDVPGLLGSLRSGDEEERERALAELYTNIFHQGTRYPAGAHAVPFLVRLALDPATPDRAALLSLLGSLALGYDEAHLPDGVAIAAWRAESAIVQAGGGDDAAFEPVADAGGLGCYDAVRAAVPLLLPLLGDADPVVRRIAAYVAGWFPEEAAVAGPALRDLAGADPDPRCVATALFALSLLPNWDPAGTERVMEAGLAHDDGLVRDVAAIALVNLRGEDAHERARAAVRGLLTATDPTPLPYGDGVLATLATRVSLRRLPGDAPARLAALTARLAAADPEDAFPIADDLLRSVFAAPHPAGTPLTATQREALAAVAGLSDEAWSWINLWEVLRAHGVPGTRDELVRLLAR
ncbi:HEAT repeat domain-containing protein [Nonomuraea zeae]|uniref:HEAT repeat domain-containing protein n=1 Tax=Nonomuraea zeae TaxID=1642303 RepID=A0A5S4F9Q9_9ACTN|nr:HEAT repeat domain-containing protein [Nonomuraea zeae]TMR13782.1 hypothetical protein ETD85_57375 [Nonomuraea zeae]